MSPRTINVIPTSEVPVPLPGGRVLTRHGAPAEGYRVEPDIYVLRRIRFGELAEVTPPPAPPAASAAPSGAVAPMAMPPGVPKQAPSTTGAE